MDKRELIDRIETWLMIHTSNDRPLTPRPTALGEAARVATESMWLRDLLATVVALDGAPSEVKKSPTGAVLAEAVALAREARAEHLPAITEKLTSVLRDLRGVGRA